MNKCELCDINGDKFDIIYDDEKFYVVFDNYGIHYSHILVIPKIHKLNLSNNDKQFTKFINKIYLFYKQYFNCSPVIYEHGNVNENLTTNPSIDHAHIHIIADFSNNVKKIFTKNSQAILYDFNNFYMNVAKKAYHAISNNVSKVSVTEEKLPSQYFRKLYALSNNQAYWDWRVNSVEIKEYNNNNMDEKNKFKEALGEYLNEN